MRILARLFGSRRAGRWLRDRQERWREAIESDLVDLAMERGGMTEQEAVQRLEDGTLIDRLREILKQLPEWLEALERIAKLLALFV